MPLNSSIVQIDAAIQAGRGAAAQVIGQTFKQYRLSSSTNNGVVSGTPFNANFLAKVQRITSRTAIEDQVFDLIVFKATCDNRTTQFGDVMVETGYGKLDNNIYTVAQMRPTKETLWIRTEFNAAITRPYSQTGRSDQMPATGVVSVKGWSGAFKSNEEILTLTGGLYAFRSSGTEANVQIGLQPLNRIRDPKDPKIPTAFYREHFLCYVPDLPGEQLQELDIINLGNSDRYEVAMVYDSVDAGIAGTVAIVEKMGV